MATTGTSPDDLVFALNEVLHRVDEAKSQFDAHRGLFNSTGVIAQSRVADIKPLIGELQSLTKRLKLPCPPLSLSVEVGLPWDDDIPADPDLDDCVELLWIYDPLTRSGDGRVIRQYRQTKGQKKLVTREFALSPDEVSAIHVDLRAGIAKWLRYMSRSPRSTSEPVVVSDNNETVRITKKRLRLALRLGETTLRKRLRDGTIKTCGNEPTTSRCVTLNLSQFSDHDRTEVLKLIAKRPAATA